MVIKMQEKETPLVPVGAVTGIVGAKRWPNVGNLGKEDYPQDQADSVI
jgi:hypothetical protein